MEAVILAAGMGTRFGADIPKTLLRVGGMTLLERTVVGLHSLGIDRDRISLVTGFRHDLLEGRGLRTVYNPQWQHPGTLSSFMAWARHGSGKVLVVHGDLVWSGELLKGMLEVDGDIVVAMDPRRRCEPEGARVEVRENRVLHISKGLPCSRSAGECPGVFLVRDAGALLRISEDLASDPGAYLDDAVNRAAGTMRVIPFPVGGSGWEEIDFVEDLARARELFP